MFVVLSPNTGWGPGPGVVTVRLAPARLPAPYPSIPWSL